MSKKTQADNFFNSLKENPDEIIEWAKREIVEYEKLIQLITKEKEKWENGKS